MSRPGSGARSIAAGLIVIGAGFGVALVKTLRFPDYDMWLVVLAAVIGIALIRGLGRRRS